MKFTQSRFGTIVLNRCPRCRKGDLFTGKNPYNLNRLANMPRKCPVCSLKFEPEAGFYYGAMFLSYGIGVLFSLLFFLIFNFLFHLTVTTSFIIVAALWLCSSPLTFRFCRSLWLSLYVNRHRDI